MFFVFLKTVKEKKLIWKHNNTYCLEHNILHLLCEYSEPYLVTYAGVGF